MTKTALILC